MLAAVGSFACAFGVSCAATPLVRKAAERLGFLDQALSSRKVHGCPVPRLGGVAIVFAFAVSLAAAVLASTALGRLVGQRPHELAGLLVGGALVVAIGVWDDLRGAGARSKLTVQFAAAGVLWMSGFRIASIALPYGHVLELGWVGLPFTLLWVAGVVNALNLIDGLDGLAGGVALIAMAALVVLAAGRGDVVVMMVTATLAGATLGFLLFNFNPASIFMGDTGSMFLGFVLAAASLRTSERSPGSVALVVPVVLLGLPIADTLLAVARRALRAAPLFSADRDHVHHRLLARGLSQARAVVVLYGVAAGLAIAALVLAHAGEPVALLASGVVVVAAGGALLRLGYLDWRRIDELVAQRRRNLEMWLGIRRAADRLRFAAEPIALWDSVREAAPVLQADHVALRLAANGEHVEYESQPRARRRMVRARFRFADGSPHAGTLELGWADGRDAVGRDTELAVERLCVHLGSALDRIDRRTSTVARGSAGAKLVGRVARAD